MFPSASSDGRTARMLVEKREDRAMFRNEMSLTAAGPPVGAFHAQTVSASASFECLAQDSHELGTYPARQKNRADPSSPRSGRLRPPRQHRPGARTSYSSPQERPRRKASMRRQQQ